MYVNILARAQRVSKGKENRDLLKLNIGPITFSHVRKISLVELKRHSVK